LAQIAHQKFQLAPYSSPKTNFVPRPKIEGNIQKILPPPKGPLGG